MRFLFISFGLFLAGCASLKLDRTEALSHLKNQASQHANFYRDGAIFSAIATRLNDVLPNYFKDSEYFLIELLNHTKDNPKSYILNGVVGEVVEIKQSDYNDIFTPKNKWAKLFLVIFPKLDRFAERNMKLNILTEDNANLKFDFKFKNLARSR